MTRQELLAANRKLNDQIEDNQALYFRKMLSDLQQASDQTVAYYNETGTLTNRFKREFESKHGGYTLAHYLYQTCKVQEHDTTRPEYRYWHRKLPASGTGR